MMMSRYLEETRQIRRIRWLLAGVLLGVAGLMMVLYRMQVRQSERYAVSLSRQSIRRIRLPAQRGRIFDRSGRILAGNRPAYELVLFLEEFRRPGGWNNTVMAVMSTLDALGEILETQPLTDEARVRAHIHRRLPVPLVAWSDLDPVQMARFAERRRSFPGVDIQPAPLREYPLNALAGHVLGYVGRADPAADTDETQVSFYLPESEGKSGLEAQYDDVLRGQAGGLLIRVDAAGYRWEDIPERPAVPGDDIQVALDATIQQWVERELSGVQGAAVILDPRNGDVLAMASSPAYNPNRFVPVILSTDWNQLRQDERAPLLNRATAGRYPPGSIVKPLVGIGALINRLIEPDTEIVCTGSYSMGSHSVNCWRLRGHGPLTIRQATEQSCNPFFIDLAIRGGYEMFLRQASAVGLGRTTGVDLPHESAGLLPDDYWKRRVHGDGWRSGDTANVAIGQGALLVTPLQMAVMAAALANNGWYYPPRLAIGRWDRETRSMHPIAPQARRTLGWSPEVIAPLRLGLFDVVRNPSGTGHRAHVPGLAMAGKTGTAQLGDGRKHTWMIAFAPFDRPRYALAMIVEDAESGGLTVAPRVARLMTDLLGGGGG